MKLHEPDMRLDPIQVGGTEHMPVRTWYQPTCLLCGSWQDEPHPTRTQAHAAYAMHLKSGSCATVEGANANAV